MNRLFIGCMAVALLLGLFIQPIMIHAEKGMQEIENEQKKIKSNLGAAEKEVANLLIDIEEMNASIQLLEETLLKNRQQIKKTEKEIKTLKNEIKKLEIKIADRYEILKDRAKSLQASGGNIKYLDVLFGAEDFGEFVSRATAITQMTNADATLMEEQEQDKMAVENKLHDLESLRMEMQVIEENIVEQKAGKIKQIKELENKKTELNTKIKKLEIKDDELQDLRNKLQIQTANSISISYAGNQGNGELGWPTNGGYISSPMAMRWGKLHKGIDIARTDRSTSPPIYAAEDGIVESAGFNNGGYGNMVIIHHGDGLKTLYAHMASLTVSNGQKVKRGQQIGVMGQTGDSTGIHLHFEVHVHGELKNPVGYIQ